MQSTLLILALILPVQESLPAPQEIVAQSVERTLASRTEFEARGITYKKRRKKFDTSQQPHEILENHVWLMWYEDGESREQLVEKNGKQIIDAEPKSPGADAFVRLANRYIYTWNDSALQVHDDVFYYVIDFKPREDSWKAESREEEVLARMVGTMFIDIASMHISQLSARLPQSFRFGPRIFPIGKVNYVRTTFNMRLFQNLPVFSEMDIEASYAIFGVQSDVRYELTYFGYTAATGNE